MKSELDYLRTALKEPKPVVDVRSKMSPLAGDTERYYRIPNTAQGASVLLLLYQKLGKWHTIFMKRTTNEGDKHAGQISFPGGRIEQTDLTPEYCALRETEEELGIPKDLITIIGQLSDLYVYASNYLVYPFVGMLEELPLLQLDEREVHSVIEAPIDYFREEEIIKKKNMIIRGFEMKDVPYYDLYGEVLWGATAMMFSEFLDIWSKVKVDYAN